MLEKKTRAPKNVAICSSIPRHGHHGHHRHQYQVCPLQRYAPVLVTASPRRTSLFSSTLQHLPAWPATLLRALKEASLQAVPSGVSSATARASRSSSSERIFCRRLKASFAPLILVGQLVKQGTMTASSSMSG